jgi:hypothetical protein
VILRALRSLCTNLRFSMPAAAMLSFGIALSLVCYALLETSVWKALPFPASGQLAEIRRGNELQTQAGFRLAWPDFDLLSKRARSFQAIG